MQNTVRMAVACRSNGVFSDSLYISSAICKRKAYLLYIRRVCEIFVAFRFGLLLLSKSRVWFWTSSHLVLPIIDINEFDTISKENLSPGQQKKLLGILEAFALLPTIIPDSRATQITEKKGRGREAINVTTTINNTNSQAQNQAQTIAVELFLEAIKDDLTGRQIKELKEVVAASNGDLQKAKPGIIEKLKSFGADITSNVVANLITNPAIWASF